MIQSKPVMNKKVLLPLLALVALTAAGCGKARNCECTVEDATYNYNPVMIVDHGMRCEDITEMALEEKYVAEDGTQSLRRIDVHKVHCHEQRQ